MYQVASAHIPIVRSVLQQFTTRRISHVELFDHVWSLASNVLRGCRSVAGERLAFCLVCVKLRYAIVDGSTPQSIG